MSEAVEMHGGPHHGEQRVVNDGARDIIILSLVKSNGKNFTRKGRYTRVSHAPRTETFSNFEWAGYFEEAKEML